jgi:RimJ/RimL family protein N-acetyltransferase
MSLQVREMELSEFGIVIDYFHSATPEYLETLGVDPTRLPRPEAWGEAVQRDYAQSRERRASILALWLRDDVAVGFSTCDKIVFGKRANMNLHIVDPDHRLKGDGSEFVRRSINFYFDLLRIKSLFCEPNAFNIAPNRTLQKAGFKYLKTYYTVPGPLNFHQAVTRWVIER